MTYKVIGLVSGGKDSLYSLAHCIANGHNVVALANLSPVPVQEQDNGEAADLDSFMYQTVGHSVVHLYSEALQVPLYRRTITGTARQTQRDYDTSTGQPLGDETEDMYQLIHDILKHQPDATALSAGAILSTYQRTRVESIALRLGLRPLAYLWQYPALPPPPSRSDSLTGLLDDMAIAGFDACIIKIASGGIPASLMNADITSFSTRRRLINSLAPFCSGPRSESDLRGAVLGEGGEFETLSLSGPRPLWKRRLSIHFGEHSQGDGGASYTKINSARTVELLNESSKTSRDIPVPEKLDPQFSIVLGYANASPDLPSSLHHSDWMKPGWQTTASCISSANLMEINNVCASAPDLSAADQLEQIIDRLQETLAQHKMRNGCDARLSNRDIVSAMLILASMDDFAAVNVVYSKKLWSTGLPIPPARVTLSSLLPDGVAISMSLVLDTSHAPVSVRKGLHVQSLSYWAPANIGPYAQAVNVSLTPLNDASKHHHESILSRSAIPCGLDIVYMAGQIPLRPADMEIISSPFTEAAVVALQHLWRVAQERTVDAWVGPGIAYLADSAYDHHAMEARAKIAAKIWRLSHRIDTKGNKIRLPATAADDDDRSDSADNEQFDVWDAQLNASKFGGFAQQMTCGSHLHPLPNNDIFGASGSLQQGSSRPFFCPDLQNSNIYTPAFIAAHVKELPRRAPIEWSSLGLSGLSLMTQQDLCRVRAFRKRINTSISLCGIMVEHEYPHNIADGNPAGTGGTEGAQSKSYTIFVTILLGPDCNGQLVTEQLGNTSRLLQLLFQNHERLVAELVSSQVWLNLSCHEATPSLLKGSGLLENALTVQCRHLWVRSDAFDKNDDADDLNAECNVEEIAAVAACRVDACYVDQ